MNNTPELDLAANYSITRRRFLGNAALATAAGLLQTHKLRSATVAASPAPVVPAASPAASAATATVATPVVPAASATPLQYKISVCDIYLNNAQKPKSLDVAKKIGIQGLEVSMGSLGKNDSFDNKLANPDVLKAYLDRAKEDNIEISSVAMTGLYGQSFAERPTYELMVQDSLNLAKKMNARVVFLPLGTYSDLAKNPELRPAVVERLKKVGANAQKMDLIIGIETTLDATGEAKLIDDVALPSVRSYFNFANALQSNRDLHRELKILGKDRICQIYCTDKNVGWLQNDSKIDVPKVKKTLDEMGWSGWLVMIGSRDPKDPNNYEKNFGANATYLKSIFQTKA